MFRKLIAPALAALAVATISAPALARSAPPRAEIRAEIPFADHGGVRDWRAVGDREIWFQDSHRRWFRAVLMGPATDLAFAEGIRIDAGPNGTLDRFGAIYVRGHRYVFASFERMPGPPPKKAGKRP
jgi:hypothetical protein